ncbi:DUF4304 domain-containing protein [Marinoscillum sp. 108]|uniref:DUF4304 domain-containing protein n=1 Tax=Marinoscillum sp. 108 TaxID=2653151 RepID=UPI0013598D65|nr:DUF4304 domain-containing protein [Marinoscillum sp. 108]
MTNEEFKNLINQLLSPLGLKRRGNYWRTETEHLEKICNLQKCNFSNLYYFNYGFNFKNLKYDDVTTHIGSRLSQITAFDLEATMNDSTRRELLEQLISTELTPKLQLNTEADIIGHLSELTHPNAIPLKVKEYLQLND